MGMQRNLGFLSDEQRNLRLNHKKKEIKVKIKSRTKISRIAEQVPTFKQVITENTYTPLIESISLYTRELLHQLARGS